MNKYSESESETETNTETNIETETETKLTETELTETDTELTDTELTDTELTELETETNTELNDDICLYELNRQLLNENNKEVKDILLEGDDRITIPIMTKYEYVRIVGNRAKQISLGSKKFIKNADHLSPKEIAILELKYKMSPFKIKRPLPNNRYEIWRVSELEIPNIE